jgi:hypothetical protein
MVQDIILDEKFFIHVRPAEQCLIIHIGKTNDWPSNFQPIETGIGNIISHESLHRAIFVLLNYEEEYAANVGLDRFATSLQRYDSHTLWTHPEDAEDECGLSKALLRRVK